MSRKRTYTEEQLINNRLRVKRNHELNKEKYEAARRLKYQENKEEINQHQRAVYAKEKQRILANNKKSAIKRRWDVKRRMMENIRSGARARNLECKVSYEDIDIPPICPYLGIALDLSPGLAGDSRYNIDRPSVDRIDNSKGYIPGNIMVISHLANSMKRNATIEQLIAFAKGVLKIHGGVDCNQVSSECRSLQQV